MMTFTITLLTTLLRQRTIGIRVCVRRQSHFDNYIAYKKNIKTNLLEQYVNFVHVTKKQNKYFELIIILFMVNLCLFLFFLLYKYLNEKQFLSTTNTKNKQS